MNKMAIILLGQDENAVVAVIFNLMKSGLLTHVAASGVFITKSNCGSSMHFSQ